MTGKNCVAIAADTRYGIRNTTVGHDFRRIFQMHPKCFVGLSGLASDVQTVHDKLKFRVNMYRLREKRDIKPSSFANLVSSVLYERRFGPWFTEPVIAGLEGPDNKPFVCAQDLIGAACYTDNFVVSGTSSEALYGMCESLWKPDMDSEELFECISQSLLAAVDRDCLTGWGAVVYVVSPDEKAEGGVKVVKRRLKTRMD
eukprot:CAMPEP_0117450560 /NCGR_PEP_ID=MMETSP0759-20121206/8533_1 /TAXON_ID=63605 /ORGANISM="Percolomonas cosmopolitus, Strain WS" /LENGTH=199 /DNA_ID=CAMNT_0005243089 /DNA_START=182 /DNA_END=781 /DNA_ORIENTATION=-